MSAADPFDLERFVDAQNPIYERVLTELRAGRKRSHWMWFVFPQLAGLGRSATSERYAIKSLAEAEAYLRHPVLAPRLVECTGLVLAVKGRSAGEIFGSPDDLKFRSSMTLFERVAGSQSIYATALAQFFAGKRDARTQALVAHAGQ